jgi:hypothetical protein
MNPAFEALENRRNELIAELEAVDIAIGQLTRLTESKQDAGVG